jgi:tRNA 2-thiouridine synthesizing protein A
MDGPLEADEWIDTVGLYCPVPIIRTAERLRKMSIGRTLEIRSDDRVILIDMPAWCRSTGNDYLGHRHERGEYRLFIRKAGEGGSTR